MGRGSQEGFLGRDEVVVMYLTCTAVRGWRGEGRYVEAATECS